MLGTSGQSRSLRCDSRLFFREGKGGGGGRGRGIRVVLLVFEGCFFLLSDLGLRGALGMSSGVGLVGAEGLAGLGRRASGLQELRLGFLQWTHLFSRFRTLGR